MFHFVRRALIASISAARAAAVAASHAPAVLRRVRTLALTAIAALTLVSCGDKTSDLPPFAPATQVVVTDYSALASLKPGAVKTWTVTDAPKVARLAQLADAQGQGWRDIGAVNMTTQTGIEMKFGGPGVNHIFAVYPRGFESSLGTGAGNLWSREDRVGPITQSKLIPDEQLDKLVSDIRATVQNVTPDATPTAATAAE